MALATSSSLICLLCFPQVVDPGSADDMRDRVLTTSGREVRGRIVTSFDPEELLILQGGKRLRIPRDQVSETTSVRDHLREFIRLQDRAVADISYQWLLAEWARSRELHGIAHLMAYRVLLADGEHEKAHRLLGHRRSARGWLWKRKSRFMPRRQFDDYVSDWGHALELRSEHFSIRTNAGLQRAVNALLDLERLYMWWFDRFGPALNLQEVLKPMEFHVWSSAKQFPGWTEMRLPYYIPRPYDDTAFTFHEVQSERPLNLFRLGTEHILNRALAVDADAGSRKNRVCAWLELGLGQWAESCFRGPAGQARPGPAQIDPNRAAWVLTSRRYQLKHLLHRHVRDSYYAAVTRFNALDWAYAHMFVAYLMDDRKPPPTRDLLLDYAVLALRRKLGDSSRAFDRAMGRRIETFEKPWAEWLELKSR